MAAKLISKLWSWDDRVGAFRIVKPTDPPPAGKVWMEQDFEGKTIWKLGEVNIAPALKLED